MLRFLCAVLAALMCGLLLLRLAAPSILLRMEEIDGLVSVWQLELQEGGQKLAVPTEVPPPHVHRWLVTGPATVRAVMLDGEERTLRLVRGSEWVVEEVRMRGLTHLRVMKP